MRMLLARPRGIELSWRLCWKTAAVRVEFTRIQLRSCKKSMLPLMLRSTRLTLHIANIVTTAHTKSPVVM
jgi:hypothetical protein